MRSSKLLRMRPRHAAGLVAAAAAAAYLLGCGDDTLTGLGSDRRTHPDSLRTLEITTIDLDSVYPVPVSLGRSSVAQIGAQFPYRSHILLDFRIPTLSVVDGDSLRLDTATLLVRSDSLLQAPFTGAMRIGLQEVAEDARGWSADSLLDSSIVVLPPLDPEPLARDTVLVGAELANKSAQLRFQIDLAQVADYDSVRTAGGTLEVNVALVFEAFETAGEGFLTVPFKEQLIGFSNDQVEAIATVSPRRGRSVVELDPTYTPGPKLVVSDGFRWHSFVQFDSLRNFLPDSALIFRADLVLTVVDSLDGSSFGIGPTLGVIVPDTLAFTNPATNLRTISFRGPLTPVALSTVIVPITPYVFDQQEGRVPNRGMILGLPLEGVQVRHFEFYGSAAADSLRPRLKVVWGFPAPFEGGRR